nr:hypothetical protein [Tanacetum cinerariifolium]
MSFGAYGDERVVGIIARAARMHIDYRELSKIDLYSGCHQMRVHEDEIPNTDFRMRYRHFEFTVYMKSKEEHESHLKMNLELLRKEKCHVKPNKKLLGTRVDMSRGEHRSKIRPDRDRVGPKLQTEDRTEMVRSGPGQSGPGRSSVRSGPTRHNLLVFGKIGPDRTEDRICTKPRTEDRTEIRSTDGQSERTFRTLENMFRACVRNLMVVGILTFREAEIRESKMIGLEMEQETTKVVVIKENCI